MGLLFLGYGVTVIFKRLILLVWVIDMVEFSKSHKARIAIRTFKVMADALTVRGFYKPSGKSGSKLAEALKLFSPEIYGSMGDSRIVELKGLEYVIDRLPRGIEKCNRIILTAQEDFHQTSFEEVIPLRRRRNCYIVSEKEICFIITRGLTEIYDIITHLTFLHIESQKIYEQMETEYAKSSTEWLSLESIVQQKIENLSDAELDQAIWNCAILLGRTFDETRESFRSMEDNHRNGNHNSGFFRVIFNLGNRVKSERDGKEEAQTIYFTPSLHEMIEHHKYASEWALAIQNTIGALGFEKRKMHIVSANMHSVKNLLYGAAALENLKVRADKGLYETIKILREYTEEVDTFAQENGLYFIEDQSGSNIDVQIIDTSFLEKISLHPELQLSFNSNDEPPLILVMDYAFGTQAFQVMDELLGCLKTIGNKEASTVDSISIMGKAGILPGRKGDIMLATAYVMEGTPHSYIVNNDLTADDFESGGDIYTGPMVTVLGTSLQNRDVLDRFHSSSWNAIGLEMEGAHYQRAINAAIIQGNIEKQIKVRYAYYASDNPLISGETLAAGPMGDEGIVPTYLITKVILRKILSH